MITVRSFILGYYPIRGFLAWAENTHNAIFIDPGGWDDAIEQVIDEFELTVDAIVLTHGHDDHTGGLLQMVERLAAPVYAHAGDINLLPRRPDVVLEGGECIQSGEVLWQVLSIPGHTAGSVAYTADNIVFTGDTLFAGSIGGTSSMAAYEQERHSIRTQLLPLGSAVHAYPAHGPATTLGIEQRCNPFLR